MIFTVFSMEFRGGMGLLHIRRNANPIILVLVSGHRCAETPFKCPKRVDDAFRVLWCFGLRLSVDIVLSDFDKYSCSIFVLTVLGEIRAYGSLLGVRFQVSGAGCINPGTIHPNPGAPWENSCGRSPGRSD